MSLRDEVKIALRVSSEVYDSEVDALVSAAMEDMKRVGIDPDVVEACEGLARVAIFAYCKANFGYDNGDASAFSETYRQTVIALMNSTANVAYRGTDV